MFHLKGEMNKIPSILNLILVWYDKKNQVLKYIDSVKECWMLDHISISKINYL